MRPHWVDHRLSGTVTAVLFGWLFASIALIMEPAFPGLIVNPALEDATDISKVIIGTSIAVGVILVLSSNIKWQTQSISWKFEIMGLPILICGWAYYTITILIIDGFTLFPIFLGAGHTAACIIRIFTLVQSIQTTRTNVELLPPEVQ